MIGTRAARHSIRRGGVLTVAGTPPSMLRHPSSGGAGEDQLHPLVVPQDSHTKHEPAGRIRTPQVEQ